MRVSAAGGRALVLGYLLGVALCSAVGFTNHTVWGVAAIGLLPFLLGALAWRRRRTQLTRQRNLLLAVLALVVSIPLTRWPLWLAIASVRPQWESLEKQAHPSPLLLIECGLSTPAYPSYPFQSVWIFRCPINRWVGILSTRDLSLSHQEHSRNGYNLAVFRFALGAGLWHYCDPEGNWHWALVDEVSAE